jgi:hypothetical protein
MCLSKEEDEDIIQVKCIKDETKRLLTIDQILTKITRLS